MDGSSGERMALIHDLDMQNQIGLHKTQLIHRDEETRLLRLRMLSLQDENALLKENLIQNDERIRSLSRQCDKARTELDNNKALVRSKDLQLKKNTVDLASLKAEVDSFNASIQDSSKVLQEKFALTRELERLRPEMEHLQRQFASYQTIVAEKHDLQRQLDSLEVELENEKRAKHKSPSKEIESVTSELRLRLERTEKELSAEKRERDKMKVDYERGLAESRGHNERLEERISRLKTKLKGVQSELKETQAELQTYRSNPQEPGAEPRYTQDRGSRQLTTKHPKSNNKRRTPDLTMNDMAIPTPENDAPKKRPARKRAAEHVLLGEKSTFSITPFLNRAKGTIDDTIEEVSYLASATGPISEERDGPASAQAVDELPNLESVPEFNASTIAPKTQKPRGRPRTKALSEASASEKNRVALAARRSAGQKPAVLDEVVEEPHRDEQENNKVSVTTHAKPSVAQSRKTEAPRILTDNSVLDVDAKRKKRKLLGGANKTIFEDEDGEIPQQTKMHLGQARRLKAPLGGVLNSFTASTAFSPLKRDRRGVNASFLA